MRFSPTAIFWTFTTLIGCNSKEIVPMPLTNLSGSWKGLRTVTALGPGACTFVNASIGMTWTVSGAGQFSAEEMVSQGNLSFVGQPWVGFVSNSYEVSMTHDELASCLADVLPNLTLTGKVSFSGPKPSWKGTGTLDYCLPDCRFQVTYDLVKE